jgi:hypothetical protein
VVIPTIVLTEIYLYRRRKDSDMVDDEESSLLAELEALKAERENLLLQIKKHKSNIGSRNSDSEKDE